MDLIRAILLVYLGGFALTLVLILVWNRRIVRDLTPHQKAMIRAKIMQAPDRRITDPDLIKASAVWFLVLLILCHDWVTGKFRKAPTGRRAP